MSFTHSQTVPRNKIDDKYDELLLQRNEATRHAAIIANVFLDLHNEYGEVPEINAAYKKVKILISEYAGLEMVGL
jgi:hypothetical protein